MNQDIYESRGYTDRRSRPEGGLNVPSPLQAAESMIRLLAVWQRRQSGRRALENMSEHMRRDAGLDHEAIAEELAKPFWRA